MSMKVVLSQCMPVSWYPFNSWVRHTVLSTLICICLCCGNEFRFSANTVVATKLNSSFVSCHVPSHLFGDISLGLSSGFTDNLIMLDIFTLQFALASFDVSALLAYSADHTTFTQVKYIVSGFSHRNSPNCVRFGSFSECAHFNEESNASIPSYELFWVSQSSQYGVVWNSALPPTWTDFILSVNGIHENISIAVKAQTFVITALSTYRALVGTILDIGVHGTFENITDLHNSSILCHFGGVHTIGEAVDLNAITCPLSLDAAIGITHFWVSDDAIPPTFISNAIVFTVEKGIEIMRFQQTKTLSGAW